GRADSSRERHWPPARTPRQFILASSNERYTGAMMKTLKRLAFVALLPVVLAAAPSGYHIIGNVQIGRQGGWNYLPVGSAARRHPVCRRVLTVNGRSKSSTYIDAKPGVVVATLPRPDAPEFAVADGKGKIYVNIEATNEIVEIDAAKAAVVKKYALTGCDGPS